MEDKPESSIKTPFPISDTELRKHKGPTKESFWVVVNKVLCGSYPGALNEKIHIAYIGTLLRYGFSTFVCLCEEIDPSKNNNAMSNGLRPYFDVAKRIYDDLHFWDDYENIKPNKMDFLYFPMKKHTEYENDNKLYEFCAGLVDRVRYEECLYIHSSGGNNRAVFVSAILLMLLEDYTPEDSIKAVNTFYKEREIKVNQVELLSPKQIEQVKVIYAIHKGKLKEKEF